MSVKILAISGGSKNGTNDQMAKEALMGAQEMGAEIEFIHMLDLNLVPCNGCISCVTGKDGVFAGGSARCVRKDDLLWLEDKIYDSDGVVFVMPIFEKGVPGFFRAFQDRFAGPSHDIGMLTIAKSIWEQKGSPAGGGPDPVRALESFGLSLGVAFQLLDDNNLLPFKTGGWGSVLPGTGSVGDDTVCMMRWNRWTGNLELDSRFNAGDATSPKGCNDMDFGDAGKQWPANGTRHANAGNASPHGMSFYTVGSFRFFSNGEIGPGTHYTPGLGLSAENTF